MDDIITKIAKFEAYTEAGVVPVNVFTHDFNRTLSTLPPDEARRLKRKFRKLWRTEAKREKHAGRRCGLGAPEPTKHQKKERKLYVAMKISRIAREKERSYRLGTST